MTTQQPKVYFKKATKSLAKAKVAITGPSGAGKTYSSLLIAKGLTNNGKVGVIDTENNSASLYEDRFDGWEYFTLPVNPPYTVDKYLSAIDIAIREGMDCLVIDSLTHVWDAEGGLKQQKDALDSRGGNSFANWAPITKLYETLKAKLLHSPIHIIATMRSKQEYILEQSEKGKSAPRKVGLAPVMRDGMEYEFTLVFDIAMDHQFAVSKDRTGLFNGHIGFISESTGVTIREWLAKPKETPPPPPEEEKPANEDYDPTSYFEEPPPINFESEFPAASEAPATPPQEAKPPAAAATSKPPLKNHAPTVGPGDYRPPAGKYKGIPLKDIPANDAASCVVFWNNNGGLKGWQKEFAENLEKFSGFKL